MRIPRLYQHMLWLAVAGIALAASAGCEPSGYKISLLTYDPESDDYGIRIKRVETLENIDRLDGSATVLRGSASLKLDYTTGYLEWRQPPRSVAFDWFESDGVIIPADFDSLAMISIYYSIELSKLFFEDLGFKSKILEKMPTYYWPSFDIVDENGPKSQKDNAFYLYLSPKERSFFILPFEQMQWIPMALNTGIITHEYSHAVFDVLVWDRNRQIQDQMVPSASNFVYALNEGWADFVAVARTGDPDFISHSIPKGLFVDFRGSDVVRDASMPLNYTAYLDQEARQTPPQSFDPYGIGAFVSALMYSFENRIDTSEITTNNIPSLEARVHVGTWFVQALDDMGENLTADFELYDFFSFFLTRIDSQTARTDFCDLLFDRYSLYYEEVRGCP